MKKRIQTHFEEAKHLHDDMKKNAESGSFAHKLAAESLASHIDELQQLSLTEQEKPIFELLDFRLMASSLNAGSVPLRLISKVSEEIRQMIGYAALRLTEGGIRRKRVPEDLYDLLNLRLAGLLPGSSRLLVVAAANRDLFDDGVAKDAINRIFEVLGTHGRGDSFLEAVTDLGPSSARKLRDFLSLLRKNSAEIDITWNYSGSTVRKWNGNYEALNEVVAALDATELREQDNVLLEGVIELLSKRERIQLRVSSGEYLRILYPKKLLKEVSELHLDQRVKLFCRVTQTENPLTNESSLFYELIEIRNN